MDPLLWMALLMWDGLGDVGWPYRCGGPIDVNGPIDGDGPIDVGWPYCCGMALLL